MTAPGDNFWKVQNVTILSTEQCGDMPHTCTCCEQM